METLNPKKKMSGVYKAVFIAAIALTFLNFFTIMLSESLNQFPTIVAAATVWFMYKHNYKALIGIQIVLLMVSVFVVLLSLINFDAQEGFTGISWTELLIMGGVSLGIHGLLLRFFQKQVENEASYSMGEQPANSASNTYKAYDNSDTSSAYKAALSGKGGINVSNGANMDKGRTNQQNNDSSTVRVDEALRRKPVFQVIPPTRFRSFY